MGSYGMILIFINYNSPLLAFPIIPALNSSTNRNRIKYVQLRFYLQIIYGHISYRIPAMVIILNRLV